MQRLFPTALYFTGEIRVRQPSHEWIMPSIPCKNQYGVFKKLPSGKPDCLRVEILHFADGTERCTAAMYGDRAYVIHYEFTAHERRKA